MEASVDETDTAHSAEQYAASHPPGIGRHYWHRARNRILWSKLQRTLLPESHVLDIGCGSGIVVDFLREKGVTAFGADVGTPEPETAGVAPHLFLGQDAFALDPALRDRIDVVLLMDVLEHLEHPEAFLGEIERAFPNLRAIHVTVPARMEIWSNYDEYFKHFRRYTRAGVVEMAKRAGFDVPDIGYAFHGLYMAARGMKLLARERWVQQTPPSAKLAHDALGKLFELEHHLLPKSMKGSSIFAHLVKAA
jgi:SAM-dependent methyltransferase